MQVFTIGHSSRSFEEFAQLLQEHRIERLVDVRSFPRSKKFPHFSQHNLVSALQGIDIRYHHLKPLGGYRKSDLKDSPNQGWDSPGFRAYADHMLTDEFQQALDALIGVPPVSWTPNPLGEWRTRCQEQDELIHPSFASS